MEYGYYTESPEKREPFAGEMKSVEQFAVEEFFDFPIEEDDITNDVAFDGVTNGNSTGSSAVTAIDSCNSSVSPPSCQIPASFGGGDFTNELCVPMDDLPELEWLTKIEEESLSNEELENLNLINGMKTRPDETSPESQTGSNKSDRSFSPEMPVPAKARSKRARTGPGNWTSRLLRISPTSSSSSDSSEITRFEKKIVKIGPKKSVPGPESGLVPRDGRKCLHCATDKTPQWRTGPKGPKTLCNACGVRYKSGRLVPEYRPASSPTFMQTKHSNSHRKVMELRRQKEGGGFNQNQHQMPIFRHHHHQSMAFDVSNGEDYLLDFQPGIH